MLTNRITPPQLHIMKDRRAFLDGFRARLDDVISESGLNRSAFAASVGLDRSTLSQLLSPLNDRLPRLESLTAIATARRVSVDWLLGLTTENQLGTELLEETVSIAPDALNPADARLATWHQEASGYKIRYVPATLPDLLKSREMLRYELAHFATQSPGQAIEAAEGRLAYQRRPETDMECCTSIQGINAFARGEGIWRQLEVKARRQALADMIDRCHELYPTFRWFLYDGRERYSVPVTIFGPKRAAVYLGQMYLVLTETQVIRTLIGHFDDLIRGAVLQPTDVPRHLKKLWRELSDDR